MFRTISAAAARKQFETAPQPSQQERESARQFARLQALVAWLRENWDGTTIVIPLPLNLLNSRWHWAVKSALKQQYHSHLTVLHQMRLLPPMPDELPPHVAYRVTVYSYAPFDCDNMAALMKFPLDWMKGKYFVDDAAKHLALEFAPQQIDRRVQRIELERI